MKLSTPRGPARGIKPRTPAAMLEEEGAVAEGEALYESTKETEKDLANEVFADIITIQYIRARYIRIHTNERTTR